MHKVSIKNVSKALQGVNHSEGHAWLAVGESRPFVLDDDQMAFANLRTALEVSGVAHDPLDHDNDGRKGGSVPTETEKRGPGRPKKAD